MKHQHSRLLPIYISLAVIVGIFLAVPYLKDEAKSSFARAGKQAAALAKEETKC